MRHTYWVWGRVRQRTSPYGVGGETGYTAQEDVKSINSYNTGEGRTIGSGFSLPAFQDPPWFYLLFCPWVATILFPCITEFSPLLNCSHHLQKKKKRPSCASKPFQFSSHFSNPLLELLPWSLLSFSLESNPPWTTSSLLNHSPT